MTDVPIHAKFNLSVSLRSFYGKTYRLEMSPLSFRFFFFYFLSFQVRARLDNRRLRKCKFLLIRVLVGRDRSRKLAVSLR